MGETEGKKDHKEVSRKREGVKFKGQLFGHHYRCGDWDRLQKWRQKTDKQVEARRTCHG